VNISKTVADTAKVTMSQCSTLVRSTVVHVTCKSDIQSQWETPDFGEP